LRGIGPGEHIPDLGQQLLHEDEIEFERTGFETAFDFDPDIG